MQKAMQETSHLHSTMPRQTTHESGPEEPEFGSKEIFCKTLVDSSVLEHCIWGQSELDEI